MLGRRQAFLCACECGGVGAGGAVVGSAAGVDVGGLGAVQVRG